MMDDGGIFAAVYPSLRAFAAVVRPPDVDPDDLVQEALARTLRQTTLSALDDPSRFLRRVVLNLASSHRRSFARRAERAHLAVPLGVDSLDQYASDLGELFRLPPDQRAVIYLAVVEGLGHDAIGEQLGITAPASRARLSRGLKQLRIELRAEEEV